MLTAHTDGLGFIGHLEIIAGRLVWPMVSPDQMHQMARPSLDYLEFCRDSFGIAELNPSFTSGLVIINNNNNNNNNTMMI